MVRRMRTKCNGKLKQLTSTMQRARRAVAVSSAPRRSSARRSSASVAALRVATPSEGEQRKRNVSPLPNERLPLSRHRPLEKQPIMDVSAAAAAAPAHALPVPRGGEWAALSARGDGGPSRCSARTLRSSTLSATSAVAARAKKVEKARPSTD